MGLSDVENENQKTVQGKVTGIIYPPPDIRAIVDKTAQFVARNGLRWPGWPINHSSKTLRITLFLSL